MHGGSADTSDHRIRRLRKLLDASPEQIFARLARVAVRSLNAHGAFVALLVDNELLTAATYELPLPPGGPAPWDSMLRQVIDSTLPITVDEDPPADPLLQSSSAGALAAVPLIRLSRGVVAVLCVVAHEPRQWRPRQIELLRDIAGGGMREIELLDAMALAERASAERAAILESAGVGICGVDARGVLTFVNPRAADLLGWTHDELRGMPLTMLQADASTTAAAPNEQVLGIDLIIRSDQPLRGGTTKLRRRDGRALPVEFSASPIRERDRVTGAVITFVDLTERRLTESEMRESEERYRRLVELLPDALLVIMHDRISFVNPAAVRLAEASSAAEMIGRRITDFVQPAMRPRVEKMLSRRGRRTGATVMEIALLRADGSTVPVEISSILVVIRGQPGIQIVLRDLSERRAAADALHRSEEQLRHSQKMEAVGRLAGGVAHDFNNILTAIRGFATLLDSDHETDALRKQYIQEILRASDRAASLTRQLLAFGRRQVLNPVVLDVNSTIREMSKLIQRLIGEDIDLALDLAKDAGRVLADPGQLEQVLMNLIVNARDAMDSGGQLTIETQNTWLDETYSQGRFALTPGRYVLIAVTDTGCGMDASTVERAFEPFFTTKPPNRGTGLGLATVYGIVKQSGGFVWAYSEPGTGTTMKVYLPQVDAEASAVPATEVPALRHGGSGTILLVEDEPAVRLLTRTLLEQHGYTVLEAPNGESALQLAESYAGPIDLLLTDVVMPRMGGRELADRLARQRAGLRIVYVSGYAEHAIARHGILEEGCMLLQKPFTPDALIALVQGALTS